MSADVRQGLVVLLGVEDLQQIFDGWPKLMNLAVCLKDSGDCSMLVFREDEGRRCLPRLKRVFGIEHTQISFFPEIAGFPTRKLLFSEEKNLLCLIENSPEVVELATDYSVNYNYALEEGLDPLSFIHRSSTKNPLQSRIANYHVGAVANDLEKAPLERCMTNKSEEPGKHDTMRSPLPRFLQNVRRSAPDPSFQSIHELEKSNDVSIKCFIHAEGSGWVKIVLQDRGIGQIIVSDPNQIFVRDDRRVLALSSPMIGLKSGTLPGQILLGVNHLPPSIQNALARNVGLAFLTVEEGYVFISLPKSEFPSSPVENSPIARASSRPFWKLLASAGFILASIVLFLHSTSQSEPIGVSKNAVNWHHFRDRIDSSSDVTDPQNIRRLGG